MNRGLIDAAAGTTGIDVWRIDLDSDFVGRSPPARFLTRAESERELRFVSAAPGGRWRACRAALRIILAQYVGGAPETLRFEDGGNGKPVLNGGDLHFNLTHSGRHAAVAVTRSVPVGIDAEVVRPLANMDAVARRFFAAPEQRRLLAIAPPSRNQAFLECWTRKESVLKATGEGIGHLLDKLVVTFGDGETARVLAFKGSRLAGRPWTVHDLSDPELVIAVAVPRAEAGELCQFRFRAP